MATGEEVSNVEPQERVKQVNTKTKKHRMVLFVGNLPFNTTKEELEEHFSKTGGVTEIRLITNKDTGESKGFGYVQFKNQQSFKKGLDLHHSRLAGRRINVEFTVPGRGKSLKRKNVIHQKNQFWKNERTNKKAGKFNKQQKKGRGRR
ncbi:uncharacterized protein LOC144447609 [Glandiceps talaboti]